MSQTTKQRTEQSNAGNGPTSDVPTVTNELARGAMDAESTVTTLAKTRHTEPSKQRNGTPTNTKRPNVTVKDCEQCGVTFETTRPKQAKFCGAICRRNAWLDRHPDKANALAERDKARLKAWFVSTGKEWID